jgi:hypothetical protein
LNIPEWKVVLRFTDMWALDALRAAAIAQLDAQLGSDEAAERLQIACAYKVPNWNLPAVRQLVVRHAPPTAADIRILDPEILAQVLRIREINVIESSSKLYVFDSRELRYPLGDSAEDIIVDMFGPDTAQ